jgi:hypothetical protein
MTKPKIILLQSRIPKVDDFTTYLTKAEAKKQGICTEEPRTRGPKAERIAALAQTVKTKENAVPAPRVSEKGAVTRTLDPERKEAVPSILECDLETDIGRRRSKQQSQRRSTRDTPGKPRRILACSCYRGEYWSLTIRQKSDEGLNKWIGLPRAPNRTAFSDHRTSERFLNSFAEISNTLYDLVFKEKGIGTTGLVVVTGGTNSGKSNVIRGLIDSFLRDKGSRREWEERKRRPHLVTYEDPIERLLITEPGGEDRWVDYTPRQRDIDVHDLKSAIKSALRQTPAAFYVGEVRDIREWRALLEFAGTGHLVFVTSHAGSLVEAMGKLFSATRSHTAARRAIVADRLAALVHLRTGKIGVNENGVTLNRNVTIPSMWRRTMVGAKTLTAEGLSSVLPHASDSLPAQGDQSSFGRVFFKDALWKRAESRIDKTLEDFDTSARKKLIEKFQAVLAWRAIEWDLEGL